jgi:energy-converting hydrogenase Eha subunit F
MSLGGYTVAMLRLVLLLLLAGLTLMCGGCQQALFPKDAPRHQFEVHNQLRGRSVPLQEPDVFGNPQPALRARLSRTR